jgi:Tol biopolymer transport system component
MSFGGQSRRVGAGLGGRAATLALLAAVGLLAGLGLALYISLPRLGATVPKAGAQFISSRAPVRLTFDRPMDHASVEAALQISPPRQGSLAWQDQTLTFIPSEPWPLSSTVTVTLAGGRSQRGLPLLGATTWTFTVAERRLAYLVGAAAPNLWISTISGSASAQQLTNEPLGVYDYAISPDGTQVAYSARRADGGDDLRLAAVDGSGVRDLVLCPGEACLTPVFSPDGQKLAYERHTLIPGLNGQPSPGPSIVTVRDLATGAEQKISDSDTRFPLWGPDGRLAYLDTTRQAVVVQNLATGAVTYVPDASGEMGTWSPDGGFIVYPEIVLPASPTDMPTPTLAPPTPTSVTADQTATPTGGEDDNTSISPFYSYLLRVNIATNETSNLSGSGVLDDASPVYSPSGGWLAFGRRLQVNNQWTPGRQLWLMRPDGTQAHPLTGDPLYNHSAFTWSPDGALLAYMRFNTSDPGAPAETWLIDVDATGAAGTGAAGPRKLVQGYLPEWLP